MDGLWVVVGFGWWVMEVLVEMLGCGVVGGDVGDGWDRAVLRGKVRYLWIDGLVVDKGDCSADYEEISNKDDCCDNEREKNN